ncbi:hypothetical protein GCM10007231_27700 [Nocardioides daphniae]|uniref:Secreted protein n=1 Tax=Nocardioides daphniae TaxID=402297 RepID=A0ABQ1QIA9_9ACTN|nr:hypothetical protein GCM10007231_27700 [Nocardioides daphniae]
MAVSSCSWVVSFIVSLPEKGPAQRAISRSAPMARSAVGRPACGWVRGARFKTAVCQSPRSFSTLDPPSDLWNP